MSTHKITAYVVIGIIEEDGFCPRNWAYLVETERPQWFIAPPGFYSPMDEPMFKSTWLTTPETLVEDLMLGLATVVEDSPYLAEGIRCASDHENGEVVDPSRLPKADYLELDRLNLSAKHEAHLVVTVLSGSLLCAQMHKFARYSVQVEICTSSYLQGQSLANARRPGASGGASPDILHQN